MLQQEADSICDDAMTTLQNMRKANNKERLDVAKEREELAKVCAEALEVWERIKAERDCTLERYHLFLSSVREIVKVQDEWKDKMMDTLIKLGLLNEEN